MLSEIPSRQESAAFSTQEPAYSEKMSEPFSHAVFQHKLIDIFEPEKRNMFDLANEPSKAEESFVDSPTTTVELGSEASDFLRTVESTFRSNPEDGYTVLQALTIQLEHFSKENESFNKDPRYIAAANFIERNLDVIQPRFEAEVMSADYLSRPSQRKQLVYVKALRNLSFSDEESQRDLGCEMFSQNPEILARLNDQPEMHIELVPYYVTEVSRNLIDSTESIAAKEQIKSYILDSTKYLEEREQIIKNLRYMNPVKLNAVSWGVLDGIVNEVAATYGLDGETFNNAIELGSGDAKIDPKIRYTYEKNILLGFDALAEISEIASEAPKLLAEKYGIYNFGRYPKEMLLRQYEIHDDPSVKYGVMEFLTSDFNGAFYQNREMLQAFHEQLRAKDYDVRIVEVSSRFQLARRLKEMDMRYGDQNLISFELLFGHGSDVDVELGASGADRLVTVGSIKNRKNRIEAFYEPDAPVGVMSCFGGVAEGLAQNISEKTGKVATGALDEAIFESITPIFNEENKIVDFEIEYDVPSAKYSLGKLVES